MRGNLHFYFGEILSAAPESDRPSFRRLQVHLQFPSLTNRGPAPMCKKEIMNLVIYLKCI